MTRRTANILKYALSVVLAGVLIWLAFRSVDWTAFRAGLRQTRWAFIALYFVAAVLALVFRTERWLALIRPLDPQARRMQVWDALNVGNVINVVLPGAGELARCGYVSSKRMGFDKALGTIACERLCDIVAVLLVLIAALVLQWERFGAFLSENVWGPMAAQIGGSPFWVVGAVALLLTAFFIAVFRFRDRVRLFSRIVGILKGLAAGCASIAKVRHKGLFLLHTVGIWAMYVMMFWCTIRALPDLGGLGMADALFLSAVGNLASIIPVPGGIGAYHYLVALAIQSLYALSWDTGILVATLGHEAHAVLILVLGLVSYLHLNLAGPARHKEPR